MRHTSFFLAALLSSACTVEISRDTSADADLIAAAGDEYLEFVAARDPYLKFHPRAR